MSLRIKDGSDYLGLSEEQRALLHQNKKIELISTKNFRLNKQFTFYYGIFILIMLFIFLIMMFDRNFNYQFKS